jgi:hypothetical protein
VTHLYLELAQIAFSDGQVVENEFRRIGDYFKHRLLEFQKSYFVHGIKAAYEFAETWNTLKTSLPRRRHNHFSFLQEAENDIEEKVERLNYRYCDQVKLVM